MPMQKVSTAWGEGGTHLTRRYFFLCFKDTLYLEFIVLDHSGKFTCTNLLLIPLFPAKAAWIWRCSALNEALSHYMQPPCSATETICPLCFWGFQVRNATLSSNIESFILSQFWPAFARKRGKLTTTAKQLGVLFIKHVTSVSNQNQFECHNIEKHGICFVWSSTLKTQFAFPFIKRQTKGF